ncbi:carboxylesterase family protein [Rhodococcus sp. 1168]|uniref:carboxylesterase family protein n=1 Tax=Rhodococcus sp. 1168 TaxID=2018041 RepID=UPI000A0C7E3B|nr:carboxylesterase family protein [Rhodococcus sp. 1168]ORI22640.1 hypothetical protein BJI47_18755 [Rhodococcus sp. 1168]
MIDIDADYLPQHPLDVFANGSGAPVPFIIGINSHESRFFSALSQHHPDRRSCARKVTPSMRRPCYRYHYAPRLLNLSGFHATHDTELLAVFGIANDLLGRAATLLGCRAGAVTDTMQSHWLNFAHHSVPESTWPAYTTERRGTLIIDHRSASKIVH